MYYNELNGYEKDFLLNEAAAYEALWLRDRVGFKYFSDIRATLNKEHLCSIVSKDELGMAKSCLRDKLNEIHHDRFKITNIFSEDYPKQLLDAKYPLELFYSQGDWELINSNKLISIIGSRDSTFDGQQRAHRLSKILVNHGFIIVSGLARGIDATAQLAAIHYGGSTIGVIGTPLNKYYPKENRKLQDEIAKNHLLISQVPFLKHDKQHFKRNSMFFPERNMTMSALSKATIVVEANDSSGTLIQARAALEQGRKLFILNSCFEKKDNEWPNKFLEMGAIKVIQTEDIINNI